MSLGRAPQRRMCFVRGRSFAERLAPTSIYELLYRESHRLFPDEDFWDLFAKIGRDSVPPRIVAVVMVLQRLEGSDREAVERFTFDLRWKYAAGGLAYDEPGFRAYGAGRYESEAGDGVCGPIASLRQRLRWRKCGSGRAKEVLDSTPFMTVATQIRWLWCAVRFVLCWRWPMHSGRRGCGLAAAVTATELPESLSVIGRIGRLGGADRCTEPGCLRDLGGTRREQLHRELSQAAQLARWWVGTSSRENRSVSDRTRGWPRTA